MAELPTFVDFYRAAYGYDPFPWQARLTDRVLAEGWPTLLDLPTGTGKTTALDVALYTLASAPLRMPRRTVLVVDRRIVVDQGAVHARKLLAKLRAATQGPLFAVAEALRATFGRAGHQDDPFAVAVMRGGAPRDDDWARWPDMPLLGVSTVDQVGSRLLFRGYGLSTSLAPIHAGLIGCDTLILLDEVHLALPFSETLDRIRSQYRGDEARTRRFEVVRMSATPGRLDGNVARFGLDAGDESHAVLAQRLGAKKPAKLVQVTVTGEEPKRRATIATACAEAATELQSGPAKVVGVVVNRVDTARLVHAKLVASGRRALLVTGRMRPIDRDTMVTRDLIPSAGSGRDRDQDLPCFVVATQCIEAGADLDFDALVTENASLDALRQRFGRLDRRGEWTTRHGGARAVVIARSDSLDDKHTDPVYGAALGSTWRYLTGAADGGKVIDFGLKSMPPALDAEGRPNLEVLAPTQQAPVLMPVHLDILAQTVPGLPAEPDVDIGLWLHGPDKTAAEVQIVWRADLAREALAGDESALDAARERLARVRPSSLEALSLPVYAAAAWLEADDDGAEDGVADVLSTATADVPRTKRRRRDSSANVALRREGDRWVAVGADALRPGDMIVLPTSAGGLAAGSFDPGAKDPVVDLGDLAQLRGRGIASLRTDQSCMLWLGLDATQAAAPRPEPENTAVEERETIRAWVEGWPEAMPVGFLGTSAEWARLRRGLLRLRRRPMPAGHTSSFAIAERLPPERELDAENVGEAASEDDGGSFMAATLTLRQHSADVETFARRFARSLDLPRTLAEDLALAAWLHDVGKADPRFQVWLMGGSEVGAAGLAEPLAKSAYPASDREARELARRRAGYPQGYRHELLSLTMIERAPEVAARAHDLDLVLHLVASHHGWCRPFAPPTDDPAELEVILDHQSGPAHQMRLSGSTRHRKARLDSGVAERFWRLDARYGRWTLAWLEALLRLADHRASEARADGLEVAS
jgi:CRISPR-associated endonuclease/helicase Cas3